MLVGYVKVQIRRQRVSSLATFLLQGCVSTEFCGSGSGRVTARTNSVALKDLVCSLRVKSLEDGLSTRTCSSQSPAGAKRAALVSVSGRMHR